jgi:hypothetical protein
VVQTEAGRTVSYTQLEEIYGFVVTNNIFLYELLQFVVFDNSQIYSVEKNFCAKYDAVYNSNPREKGDGSL